MIPLMQPQDVHMILEAAVKFIENHEVMEIAVASVSGASAIAVTGFRFGVVHQAKIDKAAMDASDTQNAILKVENAWLRERLKEATTLVIGVFTVPAMVAKSSPIQEAAPQKTLAEINSSPRFRIGRGRRRDNR